MQYFFDDLELPRLVKTHLLTVPSWKNVRAGWSAEGTPNNIDVVRSLRSALGRRIALGSPLVNELRELEAQLEAMKSDPEDRRAEIAVLEAEIHHLKGRIWRIPFIDPFDLRYINRVKQPQPSSQAVMFCLMDVSGRWTSSARICRSASSSCFTCSSSGTTSASRSCSSVTTRAEEVDEDTFFHSTESGGTVVSSALELMRKVMNERYSPTEWNIYGAQASDGDNWTDDSPKCRKILEEDILTKTRYFAYIQVAPEEQNLWLEYAQLALSQPHLAMKKSNRLPIFTRCFANCSKSRWKCHDDPPSAQRVARLCAAPFRRRHGRPLPHRSNAGRPNHRRRPPTCPAPGERKRV